MEITPLQAADRQLIARYGKGGFEVSDHVWRGAILVFPDHTLAWAAATLSDISLASLAPISAADPAVEILLIGTGPRMALLPAALRADLKSFGVGIEIMDTGAACRTYNLLAGEGRRVAAALLPVD